MKSQIKKILIYSLAIIVGTLSIPYGITTIMTGHQKQTLPVVPYDGRIVIAENNGYTVNYDYSRYVVGVASRLLITFNDHPAGNVFDYPEFVKVCCILANTFLTNEFAGNATITDTFLQKYYVTDEELQILWGDKFDSNLSAVSAALTETNSQILTYNNAPIPPYYHFVSNGNTRSNRDLAFLKTTNTNEDLEESGFLAVRPFTGNEFIEIFNGATGQNLPADTFLKEILQITARDEFGYVTEVRIGDIIMSGDDFCRTFGLNSPSFTITFQGDNLKIITKGIGNGYGLSLTYAFRMALNGSSCADIINYFFNNVEIKNMN